MPKSAVQVGEPADNLLSFDSVTGLSDEEYRRLRLWLNELAFQNDPLAFAALLQIWLNAHNIEWPQKVFAAGKDLSSRGRGSRTPGERIDYLKAERLIKQGQSLPEIAKELRLPRNKSNAERRKSADRLRKRLLRGSITDSLDESVIETGLRMLGIATGQEYQDFVRRTFGPAYDE